MIWFSIGYVTGLLIFGIVVLLGMVIYLSIELIESKREVEKLKVDLDLTKRGFVSREVWKTIEEKAVKGIGSGYF